MSRAHTNKPFLKRRVIVVAKRSSLSRLEDGEVDQRARVLLKERHATVKKWQPAHDAHVKTLGRVEKALEKLGVEALFLHGAHTTFECKGALLVITVGGDGTLLAASHSVVDVPILGINSAPKYSVGFFCAAKGPRLEHMIAEALDGSLPHAELTRMAVSINGQLRSERVLNEALFCHAEPAATSNYILQVGRKKEEQKSSGLWIGTAAGSTGALRSAGGRVLGLGSRQLQLVVREPYTGHGQTYGLVKELIPPGKRVSVYSKMHLSRVFLDGPYRMLSVRLGEEVTFSESTQPLRVLGLSKRSAP